MAPPPTDSGGGGGGAMKLLGGCGAAGCVGAILAVVFGIGLVFLIGLGASSSSSGPTDPSATGQPPERNASSGSLRELVSPRIGSYTLVETAPVTNLGSSLQGGVTDSLGAVYMAPDGSKLVQILLAYRSADIAQQKMVTVYEALRLEYGNARVTQATVRNRDGEVIGSRVTANESRQHVYWSNHNLLTFVSGPYPHPQRFEDSADY